MKKSCISNLFILLFLFISCQIALIGQEYTFQSIIGGSGDETFPRIVDAGNNEYLILNRTTSKSYGDIDVMLTKIDSMGNQIWTKQIGNSTRNLSREIYKTDYGFLLILWTGNDTFIDDWHIVKLDFDGNLLQEKFIGTEIDEELMCLVPIADNKLVAVSQSRVNSMDINLSILNEQLTPQLYRTFQISNADEWIRGTLVSPNNNIISVGVYRETGKSDHQPLIMSMNLNGSLNYMYTFDLNGINEFPNLIKTKDDKFLAVGYSNAFGSGDYDILLVKFEGNGDLSWVKTIGGIGDDKAFDVHYKSDNTLIITGETSSESSNLDVFMINIDHNGILLSGTTYGGEGNEYYGFTDITENNQVLIAAETTSCGASSSDILIIKTNEDGIGCSKKIIESFTVNSVNPEKVILSPEIIVDNIGTRQHSLNTKNVMLDNYLVCYSPLKIIGENEFCNSNDTIKYKTNPDIIFDFFSWEVPDGAEIISNQEDTTIFVKFGSKSGYIYLQSKYCENTKFDSLFVSIDGLLPDLGNDTIICSNTHLTLSPLSNYHQYLWQDGSDDSFCIAKDRGLYWVRVTDDMGCVGSDSIIISTIEIPNLDLGTDSIILEGEYYLLDAGPGFNNYFWNDNSTGQTMRAYEEGFYWVEAKDSDCIARDTIWLYRQTCGITVPTIFTPNGDGYNDFYRLISAQDVAQFEMTIYNLWGVELFKTTDINFKWDGTWKGTVLPSGNYVYRISYICLGSNNEELLTGKLSIFR